MKLSESTRSDAAFRIEQLETPSDDWDDFVESHPGACLGHASGWCRILERTYGISTIHLVSRGIADGKLAGLLSLADFRGLRGRRELISLPFLDASGILTSASTARSLLLDEALRCVRERGGCSLELRHAAALSGIPAPQSPSRVDLRLSLQRDEAEQWRAIGAKTRNQVRKAERENVRIESKSTTDLLSSFYKVYAANMRDLGSPAHHLRFFREVMREFEGRIRIIVAERAGTPIAGLIAIRFANHVVVPWASSLRDANKYCPNNLIYWEALRWAIAQDAEIFDFGRSPLHSGTHRFKRGWGAQDFPLAWVRLGPTGDPLEIPDTSEAWALRKLSRIWSHLPLPLTNWLGPKVRPYLSN